MSHFAKAIIKAESTGKRDEKVAALSGFNEEEKRLVVECFNPFRVFNVKKFDPPKQYAAVDNQTFQPFFSLLDSLHERELTGNLARMEIARVMSLYTEETSTYLERVLKKDLKCGFSGDSFEKIYPGLNIPRFDLMLASKIDEIAEETAISKKEGKVVLTEEILKKKYGLTFPIGAESKYDGNRLIAFVDSTSVQYIARSGKDSTHLIGLFDDELLAFCRQVGEPIVVDGEVLASSFSETMKSKGSKNDKSNLKFWAFDWMTRREWDLQSCKAIQSVRSSTLAEILKSIGSTKVVKSKSRICNNIAELIAFYKEVLAEGVDENGEKNGLGEGLILKNLNGTYEWDRSTFWFKWKPVIDLDLKIVGLEFGTKGTRLENTISRILLDGYDENMRHIKARCGSGLNNKMMDYLLKNRNTVLDMTVHIEAQELTLAQGSSIYSARFPVFIKIRYDK